MRNGDLTRDLLSYLFWSVVAPSIDNTVSTTSSAGTAFMQRKSIGHLRRKQGLHSTWRLMTTWLGPNGPVNLGSVDPKIATVGTPSSAARCIVPVSFVKTNRQILSSLISCSTVV